MAGKTGNRRALRVGDQIRREVASLLQFEVKDPRIGMVTVTAVKVTGDLGLARIYYSILGDDSPEKRKETKKGLKASLGFVRSKVGKALSLRRVPELEYIYDGSAAYAMHMNTVFRGLDDEDSESEGEQKGDAEAPVKDESPRVMNGEVE